MQKNDDCAHCGTNIRDVFIAPNGEEYCYKCMRIKYPPYLVLMKYSSGPMYNVETGVYEKFKDPEELAICGWEVKLLQELPNGTLLCYLELDQAIKCGRCSDYKFDLPGSACMADACKDHKEKKRPEKRYYPIYPSFYLNWKYGGFK